MTELTCIVCPKGCLLRVDEEQGYAVTGNACKRGESYGREELQNPTRTVTSTVRVANGLHRRLPVKTSAPIPKALIFDAVRLLDRVTLRAPVAPGSVVVRDLLGTGIDFVATRGID